MYWSPIEEEVNCLLESAQRPEPSSPEQILGNRYGVVIRYMGKGRAFCFPELGVVVLPKEDDDARIYDLFHELGHVKNGHPSKGDADPIRVLRMEAEAWRWALHEAGKLGYEIPRDRIRQCMNSYAQAVKRAF